MNVTKYNFFEKHKYFFEDFEFKFEGLKPDIQSKYEDIVKSLSATVYDGDDADYILIEYSYYKKLQNENRNNLYNISYIMDSMEANVPLDINMYRFMPMKTSGKDLSTAGPCCLFAKYILQIDSCLSFYSSKFCSMCIKKNMEEDVSTITNETIASNLSNSDNEIILGKNASRISNNNDAVKCRTNEEKELTQTSIIKGKALSIYEVVIEVLSNNRKRERSLSDDQYKTQNTNNERTDNIKRKKIVENDKVTLEKPCLSNQNRDNSIRFKKSKRKISPESDASNDFENIVRNIREDQNFKYKKAKQAIETIRTVYPKTRKENKCNNKQIIQQADNLSSDGELSLTSDVESSSIPLISSGIKKEKTNVINTIRHRAESGSVITLSSDDEINDDGDLFGIEWWYRLPKLKGVNIEYEEPKRKAGDRRRGSTFTLSEQQLMIAYLVTRKQTHLGASRLPWRQMLQEGYLRHRSVESLNNNFRRVILPKIRTFGLPYEILKEFLNLPQ